MMGHLVFLRTEPQWVVEGSTVVGPVTALSAPQGAGLLPAAEARGAGHEQRTR
jgi:hypothetical protein